MVPKPMTATVPMPLLAFVEVAGPVWVAGMRGLLIDVIVRVHADSFADRRVVLGCSDVTVT
jgi:hypothetical protein